MTDHLYVDPNNPDLTDVRCPACGRVDSLRLEWRLVINPLGTYSLAGEQMKATAARRPFLVCECGFALQGHA